MTAYAKPQESFIFAVKRFYIAFPVLCVSMNGFENRESGGPLNATNFAGHGRLELNPLHTLGLADIVHGEAAIGHQLFEGNAFAAVSKILLGRRDGRAVFFGERFLVGDGLEQANGCGDLGGLQLFN